MTTHYALCDAEGYVLRIYALPNIPVPEAGQIVEELDSWTSFPSSNHLKGRVVNRAVVWVDPRTLTEAKVEKAAQVNTWRKEANSTYFIFAGKMIAVDQMSKEDISGVSQEVALTGEMPGGFPGAWKTMDNSYVLIPDLNTWKLFIQAMVAQGTVNFARAQELKAQINTATTIAELDSVTW